VSQYLPRSKIIKLTRTTETEGRKRVLRVLLMELSVEGASSRISCFIKRQCQQKGLEATASTTYSQFQSVENIPEPPAAGRQGSDDQLSERGSEDGRRTRTAKCPKVQLWEATGGEKRRPRQCYVSWMDDLHTVR